MESPYEGAQIEFRGGGDFFVYFNDRICFIFETICVYNKKY